MKRYKVKIKERGNPNLITSEYLCCDETAQFEVEQFYGLHRPDVEWFEITQEQVTPTNN